MESTAALRSCLEIRRRVFIEGQGVPLELELDGLDEEAEHLLAWRLEPAPPTPIGTARFRETPEGLKAERVAVLDAERGRGVGRALMTAIEDQGRARRASSVVLHAQVEVIAFYERLGYEAEGEVFSEAGIDHRVMSKRLR